MTHKEQELLDVVNAWDQAIATNNIASMGNYMHADWLIVGADGITTRQSFIDAIATGILSHNRMNSDEAHVKIYGDTGIVISKGTSAGLYNGQAFSLYEWSTSTFIKQQGKWLCISTMLALVNKPQ